MTSSDSRRKQAALGILLSGVLLWCASSAQAGMVLYTSLSEWENAVTGIEVLTTTSNNVALADEVGSPPGENAPVGSLLTFQTVNTGLSRGFSVRTLQSGAGFTFDDHEGAGNIPSFDNALSVGDIDNYEDDDWRLSLLDGAVMTAFNVDLRDSGSFSGESISVYLDGIPLETLDLSSLGPSSSVFLGLTADFAFDRVDFDEGAPSDDIAIADFRFATSNQVIPEPSALVVLALGVAGLVVRRRQQLGN